MGSLEERVELLGRYVAAGLERDERVLCLTREADLLGDLARAGVPGVAAARADQLVVRDVNTMVDNTMVDNTRVDNTMVDNTMVNDTMVGADGRVRPPVLQQFEAACERALQDGFTGLRAASDASAFPVATRVRSEFVRLELEFGELVSTSPFTALCMYDIAGAGERDTLLISSVHEQTTGRAPPSEFGIRRVGEDEFAVAGEIDLHMSQAWSMVLDALTEPGVDLTLDLGCLEFIDIAGLRVLARSVQQTSADNAVVTLRRMHPIIERCIHIIGLHGLAERVVH